MKICPVDKPKFIGDLITEINFYDGKNIQLKDNCSLLESKLKTGKRHIEPL